MNCEAALNLFSGHLEGDLSAQQGAEFAQHLEQCAACHASYESFRYALGDLQSLTLRETSRDEVAAVMAAVELAPRSRGIPRRTLLTHLAAAGVGAVLVWIFWPQEVRIEELIVEQRVEVPVEVPTEVPVERIVRVEVPVEVLVKVPVEVERVVTVVNPLQVHFDRFLALNESLIRLADLAAQSMEVQRQELAVTPATPPTPPEFVQQVAAQSPRKSPVKVLRSEGRLSLTTRGSTAEVVPALIAMLSDENPQTRSIVEQRLEQFRSELGGTLPPTPRQRAKDTSDFGWLKSLVLGFPAEEERPPTPTPSESWRTWWDSRGEELIAFETQPSY